MKHLCLAVVVMLGCAAGPAAAQSPVSIRFDSGRVTLVARNAPLRTVLAEWSRVGGSKIVNAERLPSTPVTLELTDWSERKALGVLLRSVGGHAAATRQGAPANASTLDRIFLLPTPALQQAAASAPTPAAQPQPSPVVRFVPGEPDDNLPEAAALAAGARVQQQLVRDSAAAAAAAREAAEAAAEAKRLMTPATTPGFPGNVIPGRPGEITPVTRPRTATDDDDER